MVSRSDTEQLRVVYQKTKTKHAIEYLWVGCSKLCWNQFFVASGMRVYFIFCVLPTPYCLQGIEQICLMCFPRLYVLFFLGKRCSHYFFWLTAIFTKPLNEGFSNFFLLTKDFPNNLHTVYSKSRELVFLHLNRLIAVHLNTDTSQSYGNTHTHTHRQTLIFMKTLKIMVGRIPSKSS